MNWKFACHTITWGREPDVRKMLEEIAALGYQGVEFMQPPEYLGDAGKLGRTLRELGLRAVGLYGRDIQKTINYVAQLGAPYLLASDFSDYSEELAKEAARTGVQLVLHPHVGPRGVGTSLVETREDVEKYLATRPGLMLCPDTAHLTVAGSDPAQVIREFASRVVLVHLKDWVSQYGTGPEYGRGFCELGEGTVDIAGALAALREIGYDGWLTVELDTTRRTPAESARISRDYLRAHGYWPG